MPEVRWVELPKTPKHCYGQFFALDNYKYDCDRCEFNNSCFFASYMVKK